SKDCYECLERLAYQAAGLATSDERAKARAIEQSLKVLKDNFSYDKVSIVIATRIHDVIREITENPDPYREMKDKEIAVARELSSQTKLGHNNDFGDRLRFAALGNAIDFFRPLDDARRDMRGQLDFAIDDSKRFEARFRDASEVLYLADNAGEVFFDLPLVKWMRQFAHVVYVVKASPVQDDVTPEDVKRAGLEAELGEIITTGTATPGIDFSVASAQFKNEFDTADLIFAKGMGYYESLSELPAEGRVFYCLKAKCQPVADSIGVPLHSYVAMLR
ncbi:MAG: DUF89 family protein, partial [Dehalococcoidia bacterium]|nr:DUF89 family protein [Dehalococcoidia bacterium]